MPQLQILFPVPWSQGQLFTTDQFARILLRLQLIALSCKPTLFLFFYFCQYQLSGSHYRQSADSQICFHIFCSTNLSLHSPFPKPHFVALLGTCTQFFSAGKRANVCFSFLVPNHSRHFSRACARSLHLLNFPSPYTTTIFRPASAERKVASDLEHALRTSSSFFHALQGRLQIQT